ncbi:MAG: hypothetical protein K5886_09715 [Lachnospiraceae bacterium]|nr:hypothetical protein [Lachnospiraceae bacterium]
MKKRGVLTIELSMLMPLILGSIILIIFLAFYLHDRCLISKACYTASLRGSLQKRDEDAYDGALKALDEVMPAKLSGKWDEETAINIKDDRITVILKGSLSFDKGLLFGLADRGSADHTVTSVTYRTDEAAFMRSYRAGLHIRP